VTADPDGLSPALLNALGATVTTVFSCGKDRAADPALTVLPLARLKKEART